MRAAPGLRAVLSFLTPLVLVSAVAPGGTAGAAPRSGAPLSAFAIGPDNLRLLSQTPWVGPGPSDFQLRLQVTASQPAGESLALIVYDALTSRSAFEAAADGDVHGPYYVPAPLPLGSLAADRGGGVNVDIPVNRRSGGLSLSTTGVYPVQAFLEQGGVRTGQPLTVFLVYVDKYARELHRLDAAFVLPFASPVRLSGLGVPDPNPDAAASSLGRDASMLVKAWVPVTLQADAATIVSIEKAGPAGQAVLANIKQDLEAGGELLPSTALPVDIAALVSSGLEDQLRAEVVSGGKLLEAMAGAAPSLATWVFGDDIDASTLAALAAMGAKQVVVPEEDLSSLPAADSRLTFARPAELALPGDQLKVVGADAGLSSRLGGATGGPGTVLLANRLLAELAMIDLETPSYERGVVLEPPPGTTLDPAFLSIFLSGLHDNPLVKAVSVQQLFSDVPMATTAGKLLVRTAQGHQAAPLPGVEGLADAEQAVLLAGEVYGNSSAPIALLEQQLTTSLSSLYSGSTREALLVGVLQAANRELAKLHMPAETSITLTSRQGRLPLSFASTSGLTARIRLVLTSEQLSFVATRFAEGRCFPVNLGSEYCLLTLSQPATTLQVPVVARTSGSFPLSLAMGAPDGSAFFAQGSITVRSTAISDLGLILMLGAALFLAVWWARNARHGRRARRLVPRDEEPSRVGNEAGAVRRLG
ncbi:MAG TPA: DUF6049 family protein [Acidimicrobiales bacterium]|nr:DUF6049 family protein [Acidimicrobiales bacterium]